MRRFGTILLVSAVLVVPAPTRGTTWHVPAQCPTIQAGIDSASAGDTVLVACATYYEHDIVVKSGICLRSETGLPDCVTIDADSDGRVLFCYDVNSSAEVLGITMTGSSGPLGVLWGHNTIKILL